MQQRVRFVQQLTRPDMIAVEAQGELLVKGRTQPVKVYAVSVDSLVAEGV